MPTIQCRDEVFESQYTHIEAENRFLALVTNGKIRGSFPTSLSQGIRRYGHATPNQLPYVHKFVRDAERGQATPQPVTPGKFMTIVEHLTKCRRKRDESGKGLLNPCLQLKSGEQKIVMKLLGEKSKNCGGVSIASERAYGQGDYFGCITAKGYIQASGKMTQHIAATLERIAADPARVISQLGRETGHCCYCYLPLTTVQSRIAGCGDTCGQNYDVWYPTVTEAREFLKEHPEVAEGASDAARFF